MSKTDLTYKTIDSLGKVPDFDLMNTRWMHTGTRDVYELTDYVWGGESDRWYFVMRNTSRPNIPLVVRPLEHLTGLRGDGQNRYRAVHPVGGLHDGDG